jgi:Tripartite tricarboxylate transporter family receptor
MAKATTKLNAQDRVILFAARPASTTPGATGIDHAAAGILAHAMQSMAIRGFVTHNRGESNSPYGLGGPKGVAPEIVKVLHDAFKKGLDEPSNVAVMTQLDQERFYLDSEDYRAFAMQQIVQEKRMVKNCS